VERTFFLSLGEGGEMVVLSVMLDGEEYMPPTEVPRGDGELEVKISALGPHAVDIYADGILVFSGTMWFEA